MHKILFQIKFNVSPSLSEDMASVSPHNLIFYGPALLPEKPLNRYTNKLN